MKNNTKKSFDDKWKNNKSLAFAETLRQGSDINTWILKRNGFGNTNELKKYLRNKKRILDAGCGNGRVTALLRINSQESTEIVGLDLVSSGVAKENLKKFKNITIAPGDLMKSLRKYGKFDFIYCQEVLHHTVKPLRAFLNLCEMLDTGGEIAIYVYKKKAPIREFTDDYIRNKILAMDYDSAIKICRKITEFGKLLARQKIKIRVPDVPILEIKAGEYDLQRFIYNSFMKCFWNDKLSLADNIGINYDWYHPQNCSRHSIEEIRGWFKKAGLSIVQECADDYGITVRGCKK